MDFNKVKTLVFLFFFCDPLFRNIVTVLGHVCVRCADNKQPLGLVKHQYTNHDKNA